MPRLPFRQVDVLLIDEIGKNFSGVGIDTNVVGRKFNEHKAVEDEYPKVKRIALRGLSQQSHGNAIGIGMAEFCRSQLLRDTDFAATRLNVLDQRPGRGRHVPAGLRDRPPRCSRLALGTIGLVEPQEARLLWIPDTLQLARGGMFGGLSGTRPAAERPDDPHRAAAACRWTRPATCRSGCSRWAAGRL